MQGDSDAWHLTTDTLDKAGPDVLQRDTKIYLTTVARLLGNEIIPLDHRRSIAHGYDVIQEYNNAAEEDFDFQPVIDQFEAIEKVPNKFHKLVDMGQIDPQIANKIMKEISRHLIALVYVQAGRFDQGLMTQRPPFPTLELVTSLPDSDGDEYRF